MMLNRIYRSVVWLEEQRDDTFYIDRMAAVSCLSLYHFSRVFYSMTGMTPALYQRRRALTKASECIVNEDLKILEIALNSGYESQEAFTRAFKKMFGKTPGSLRKDAIDLSALKQNMLQSDDLKHIAHGGVNFDPVIRHHEGFRIYGIVKDIHFDDYHGANQLWNNYLENNNVEGVLYGVCTGVVTNDYLNSQISYLCGSKKISDDQSFIDLSEGEYACFTHKGRLSDVGTTLKYIWQCWLPKTKYQLRDAPDFEVYDERFNQGTLDGEIEIWIPIEVKD